MTAKKKPVAPELGEFLLSDTDIEQGHHNSAALGDIDFYRQRAEDSNNLMYVWLAIFKAYAAGIDMPSWCYQQIAFWAGEIYELAHGLDPDKGRAIEWPSDESEKAERVHDRWDFSGWKHGGSGEVTPGEALNKARDMIFPPKSGNKNPFNSIRIDMQGELSHNRMLARQHAPDWAKTNLKSLDSRNDRKRRQRIKPKQTKTEPK